MERVSKRFRWTFTASILMGLAAHLFALTNVLKNHDNILMTGYGAGTASGRWFMGWIGDVIQDVWGNYNIPFYNGLLGIVILAFAAYLGVLIFDIRDLLLCILWGGLFIAFPAVTSMMFYIYTVPYYSAAIFMVMLAVYLTVRYRFGWIPAIVLLTCSLGIYQAYYPLAAGLFVTILLVKSITGKYTVKQAVVSAFTYLGILAASMISYFVILQIRLRVLNIQLNTYKNIDKMGQISLAEVPDMIKRTYKEFFNIPFTDYYQMAATKIVGWMIIVLGVLCIGMIVWLLVSGGKQEFRRRWPSLVFLAFFPAAVNSITLMCYNSRIYTLMIFAGVLIYLIPILLLSEIMKWQEKENEAVIGLEKANVNGRVLRGGYGITVCALGLVLLNYIWQSNGNYTSMYYTDQQVYYYLSSMVTQVKEADGFNTDLTWVLIGDSIEDPLFQNPWVDTPFWYGGNKVDLINEYSRRRFFEQILGYQITWGDDSAVQELETNEEVCDMPTYPNDGSIKVIGEYVVIKLEDE